MVTSTASTPARQRRVEGVVPEGRLLGITLLIIGTIIAAGFVFDDLDRYSLLAISVTCLVAFALSREYGFAVPAGVTGGLGTAVLFITGGTFGPAATPGVLFLSAAILGSLGVAFAAGQPGAIAFVQIGIAAVIIVAGLGLVLRRGHEA
jgi:hypothetical protein